MTTNDEYIQKVIVAVSNFYAHATDNDQENAKILLNDINTYRDGLIPMGCAYVAEQLSIAGHNGAPYMSLMMMFIRNLAHTRSMVKAFGEWGILKLRETLQYSHEDVASIASICLDYPEFVRADAVPSLKSVFQKAEGTSCKMALALALKEHGDEGFLDHPSISEFLSPKNFMDFGLVKVDNEIKLAQFYIIMDIARDGQFPETQNGSSPWKRKQYQ